MADGTSLQPAEFADALLLRLGADLVGERCPCARCGQELDTRCRHALRCAPGPSTQGHNRVRDVLLGLASLGDSGSATEVRGLIGSAPQLRPADLLTAAAFGKVMAFDVGIANPGSRTAGDDACSSMAERKMSDYAPFLAELESDGVQYMPVVWSSWGRAHVDADRAVTSLARGAARRLGLANTKGLESRA